MTRSPVSFALLTGAALALGAPATAQMASAIALDTVLVPSADAPWLAEWYERQRARLGEVFGPRIEVTAAAGLGGALALSPSAVALLPASSEQAKAGSGLHLSETGVEACLAVIVAEGSRVQALGDLHVAEGRVRVAVASDIRHLAEEALSLYGLSERVERIATDNEGAGTATAMGEAAIGFVSASNGADFQLPDATLRLSDVPQAVLELAGRDALFVGSFRTGATTWRESAEEHRTLCDPVVAVTTEMSRFRNTNFQAGPATVAVTEETGLLDRSSAALRRFMMLFTAN